MSEDDRRVLAGWAADCAERVLPIFEDSSPDDPRPRAAIDAARAWVRGDIPAGTLQVLALQADEAARTVQDRAARSAARAAGQACAIAHRGGHPRHAAASALAAIMQSEPTNPGAADAELRWQHEHLSDECRALAYPDEHRTDPGTADSSPVDSGPPVER